MIRVCYAVLNLSYGVLLFVATFVWRWIPNTFLQSENTTGTLFAISVIFAIPFVGTYTRLGLNCAEGEEPSPATKARHAALNRECLVWPVAWYGGCGLVLLVWVGCSVVPLPINSFLALPALLSCLTGIWFLFAYPAAMRLFKS